MKYHTFIFALGIFLFTFVMVFAASHLERRQRVPPSKAHLIINLFFVVAVLLTACARGNIPKMSALIMLCAIGDWSICQVIFALRNGQVRKFSGSAFVDSTDSVYCTRAVEPGWFWYHIAVYALQAGAAFVLPVYIFYEMML